MPNTAIWEQESFYQPQDIVLVGAGLMGLWTAFELKKARPQLAVIILESGSIPTGASTRNAGFACFGSPTELLHDIATTGEDATLQLVEMRFKGIEKIKQYFSAAQIGFNNCGGFECLQQTNTSSLSDTIDYLNQLLQPITNSHKTFVNNTPNMATLGLRNFEALLENMLEGSLHSGKLVQCLTQKVQAMGVQILYNAPVTHWETANTQQIQITSHHFTIVVQQMVFCTNAFTKSLLPQLAVEPARGQILLTAPIQNLALNGTFHSNEGYFYWRNLGNRILLGGARNVAFEAENTTELTTTSIIQLALQNFLQQHFIQPQPFVVEQSWSGIMAFTPNKQPLLQQVAPNTFVAIGCNGMGVALTPILAEKMAAMLL